MPRDTDCYRNIAAARFLQKTAQQARPELCVAPRAGNSHNLELRTSQRKSTAKASSISPPMSVSMMILSVALERDTDVPVCADNKELNSMQSANIPATERIT